MVDNGLEFGFVKMNSWIFVWGFVLFFGMMDCDFIIGNVVFLENVIF